MFLIGPPFKKKLAIGVTNARINANEITNKRTYVETKIIIPPASNSFIHSLTASIPQIALAIAALKK